MPERKPAETGTVPEKMRGAQGTVPEPGEAHKMLLWRWSFRSLGRRTGRPWLMLLMSLMIRRFWRTVRRRPGGAGSIFCLCIIPLTILCRTLPTRSMCIYGWRTVRGDWERRVHCFHQRAGHGRGGRMGRHGYDGGICLPFCFWRRPGHEGVAGEMGIETMELVRKGYADSIGKALIGAFGKPIDLA